MSIESFHPRAKSENHEETGPADIESAIENEKSALENDIATTKESLEKVDTTKLDPAERTLFSHLVQGFEATVNIAVASTAAVISGAGIPSSLIIGAAAIVHHPIFSDATWQSYALQREGALGAFFLSMLGLTLSVGYLLEGIKQGISFMEYSARHESAAINKDIDKLGLDMAPGVLTTENESWD